MIATLTTQAEAAGFDVLILSGDRDAFQLVSDAVTVLSRVGGAAGALPRLLLNRLSSPELLVSIGMIALLVVAEWLDERRPLWRRLESRPVYIRWAAYYALLLCLLVLGNWNFTQFVYMQF